MFANLNKYHLTVIILLLSLLSWSIDFLSDSQITQNELKIGAILFIHHIFAFTSMFFGIFWSMFFTKSLHFYILTTVIFIGIYIGFLINNNVCWMTVWVNKMINSEKPLRKWRGAEPMAYIKHYIRGDDWAYSDLYISEKDKNMLILANISYILLSIKTVLTLK
jgi:hypothetical protein